MQRKVLWTALLAAIVSGAWLMPAFSQEGQEGKGERRGPGRMDPEEMRKRAEEFRQRSEARMKEALAATEDEWKVIQPRLEGVRKAQENARGGRGFFGGFMDPRRERPGEPQGSTRPGGGPERTQTDVEKKTETLRELLQKQDAKPAEIKEALTALRDARKKADAELAKARSSLREVLSQRQEAVMVLMGMLD